MLSSAKKRWDILGAPLLTDIPFMLPFLSFLLIIADNPSMHMRNKYEEIGSPCRSPLEGVITPLGFPLTKTE